MKFLTIYSYARELADPSGPSAEEMMTMGKLIGEMQAANVLLDFGGAGSAGTEIHVRKSGSTYTVTDGPFTESKEIVGGYAVLSVASRDEAVSWTKRFLEAAGDGISELHELMDAP
jgi:hypothetical protein